MAIAMATNEIVDNPVAAVEPPAPDPESVPPIPAGFPSSSPPLPPWPPALPPSGGLAAGSGVEVNAGPAGGYSGVMVGSVWSYADAEGVADGLAAGDPGAGAVVGAVLGSGDCAAGTGLAGGLPATGEGEESPPSVPADGSSVAAGSARSAMKGTLSMVSSVAPRDSAEVTGKVDARSVRERRRESMIVRQNGADRSDGDMMNGWGWMGTEEWGEEIGEGGDWGRDDR